MNAGLRRCESGSLQETWQRQLALAPAPLLVHRVGKTLKYRLKSRGVPPLWCEPALFWGCWARLGL
jgi:hypothetical protein